MNGGSCTCWNTSTLGCPLHGDVLAVPTSFREVPVRRLRTIPDGWLVVDPTAARAAIAEWLAEWDGDSLSEHYDTEAADLLARLAAIEVTA